MQSTIARAFAVYFLIVSSSIRSAYKRFVFWLNCVHLELCATIIVINQMREILCDEICYSNFRFVINDNNFLSTSSLAYSLWLSLVVVLGPTQDAHRRNKKNRYSRLENRWNVAVETLSSIGSESFYDSSEIEVVHFLLSLSFAVRVDKLNLHLLDIFLFLEWIDSWDINVIICFHHNQIEVYSIQMKCSPNLTTRWSEWNNKINYHKFSMYHCIYQKSDQT